jgi:hypothetical protein
VLAATLLLTRLLARVLGLLAGLLPATTLLLAGLLLTAALLMLTALTWVVGILRILRILVHAFSLQLPQPQFEFRQSKKQQSKSSVSTNIAQRLPRFGVASMQWVDVFN